MKHHLLVLSVVFFGLGLPRVVLAEDDDEFDFLDLGDEDLPERGGVKEPSEADPGDVEEGGDPDADPDWDAGPADELGDLDADPEEPDLIDPVDDPLGAIEEQVNHPTAPSQPETAALPTHKTVGIGLDVDGKVPLTDCFPVRIVAKDLDAIVVELPVLISRNRGDFKGPDYWLAATLFVDGHPISETRYHITAASIADLGPSFVWLKGFAPVANAQGTVQVKVRRVGAEGGQDQPLFETTGQYQL